MTPSIELFLVAARWVEFVAAMGLFGAAAFDVYAPSDSRRPGGAAWRVALPAVASAAAVAWSVAIVGQIAGGFGPASLPLLAQICLTTGFGRALLAAALLALALTAAGLAGARRRWLELGLAGGLLIALSFVGHAAAGGGVSAVVRIAVRSGHLLAGGAWLGGLPPLALALRRASPGTALLLRRFGVMGAGAVSLILASGIASIALVVGVAGGRLGPLYTRVLIAKLSLVAGLLAVAAVNRFRLTPLMAREPSVALAALEKTILVEQAIGLAALAAVAVLGQLDPTM
ncbi:MAG TPA: CopD family protein [Caulobacteraceae bacterium]|nr:CopD family protein [Caulobacteraceae bacterium]